MSPRSWGALGRGLQGPSCSFALPPSVRCKKTLTQGTQERSVTSEPGCSIRRPSLIDYVAGPHFSICRVGTWHRLLRGVSKTRRSRMLVWRWPPSTWSLDCSLYWEVTPFILRGLECPMGHLLGWLKGWAGARNGDLRWITGLCSVWAEELIWAKKTQS